MGLVNSPTTGHSIFFKIAPVKEVRTMISHLRRFDASTVAKERLKIIRFYVTYGERATREAFGVNRKTIYIWRKRLNEAKGNLASLKPYSAAPKRVRCIQVDPKVLSFLKILREDHPNLGKRKIKPILDVYCLKEGLPFYS